ncbi:MAG: hypothetical protein Tsb005_20470 [Gammaproteobacteria bacterium]
MLPLAQKAQLSLAEKRELYQQIIRDEFRREFHFLWEVQMGRATAKGDFTDKLVGLLKFGTLGALDNAPLPGINLVTGLLEIGIDWANDTRKDSKTARLGAQHWEIDNDQLHCLLQLVAVEAARRYEYILSQLSDDPTAGVIPFALVGVERMLSYVCLHLLPLTVEHLLQGLFYGPSGAYVSGYTNTAIALHAQQTLVPPHLKTKLRAEGVYARPAFVTGSSHLQYWTLTKQTKPTKSRYHVGYTKFNREINAPKYGYVHVPLSVKEHFGYRPYTPATTSRTQAHHYRPTWVFITRAEIEQYLQTLLTQPGLACRDWVGQQLGYSVERVFFYANTPAEADWRGLTLTGADLSDCVLPGIQLAGSIAQSRWQRALLTGADIRQVTDAQGADLSKANLAKVQAVGAKLAGAILTQADCTYTDFTNADLRQCQMTGVRWVQATLTDTRFDNAMELQQLQVTQTEMLATQRRELDQITTQLAAQRDQLVRLSTRLDTILKQPKTEEDTHCTASDLQALAHTLQQSAQQQ